MGLNPNPEDGRTGPEVKPDYLLNIKVSHGLNEHEVTVPCNSTFGDLKSVIVQKIGVEPETHKLLFRGKEKEDDENLQTAGVKDNAKVLLVEDTTCRQKSSEEVKETSVVSKGGAAVAQVREEIDKLSDQVAAVQAVVNSGIKIYDNDISCLTEMLMRQLLKLDSIEAEGEGRVQRKMEVRRVQSFVETMDILKSRNSDHFSNGNNTVAVTTEGETFEPGCESTSTVSTGPSSAPAAPSSVPITETTPSSVPNTAPASSPTHINVPSSTPTPTHIHVSTPTPVHIHLSSSTPIPIHIHVPSSTSTAFSVHTSTPMSSSAPSPMPTSTNVTQDWEHFD